MSSTKRTHKTWMAALLAASTTFLSMAANAAMPASQGMILLHAKSQDTHVDKLIPALSDQGCDPWARGSIKGAQGDFEIGSAERFIFFTCQDGILENPADRQILGSMIKSGNDVRIIEGPIRFSHGANADTSPQNTGAYVIKLSRYTNHDVEARERDLQSIMSMAAKRNDVWKNDVFVAGLRAIGTPTPDEVVVIHYDDAEQGNRFRSGNPDIMKLVGGFNEAHLIDYVYMSAVLDK